MNLKHSKTLAYLGPEGSFSHLCAEIITKNFIKAELKPFFSIQKIHKEFALVKPQIDFALLPIENSLGGSVPESLDGILHQSEGFEVLAEYVLPIRHNLLLNSPIKDFQQIKEVRAHFQAFNQCEEFLNQNLPEVKRVEYTSNSAAAKSLLELTQLEQNHIASIASQEASQLLGLQILRDNINDYANNQTRFWLCGKNISLEKQDQEALNANQQKLTSLAFRIPRDSSGGLLSILAPIAARDINLTKIESRPTKAELCEYTFFIDFITPVDWEQKGLLLLNELEDKCSYFRHLGTYTVLSSLDSRF